jgi:hypothetical protein
MTISLSLLAVLAPLLQHSVAFGVAPPRAYSVGAAYDQRRECLVIFGGFRPNGSYAGQTWEWDKRGWRRVDVRGPSARNSPTLAFDERHGTVVLFGGDDRNGPRGDTWEWNGRYWTQVAPAGSGPSPRTNARMAYDAKRGTTILHGGFAGQTVFADTWEWDGVAWRLLAAGGPPRFLHGLAIDERGGWLTYGGAATAPAGVPPPAVGDTWLSDGVHWAPWSGAGPGVRDHVTLAFDARRGRTVLYGGFLDGEPSAETWEWDGAGWDLVLPRGAPGFRSYPAMVFDHGRGRVLLYGGFDVSGPKNDLWEWNGESWRRIG